MKKVTFRSPLTLYGMIIPAGCFTFSAVRHSANLLYSIHRIGGGEKKKKIFSCSQDELKIIILTELH